MSRSTTVMAGFVTLRLSNSPSPPSHIMPMNLAPSLDLARVHLIFLVREISFVPQETGELAFISQSEFYSRLRPLIGSIVRLISLRCKASDNLVSVMPPHFHHFDAKVHIIRLWIYGGLIPVASVVDNFWRINVLQHRHAADRHTPD